MLLSIEGEEATAKTTLAYTAPLPIVGFQFDIGEKRAIYGTAYDKYFKDLSIEIIKYNRYGENKFDNTSLPWNNKDITIFELPQPIQLDTNKVEGYIDLWNFFINYLGLAASDSNVRTIIVDTTTIARRVKADAYLEELNLTNPNKPRKQLLQIEYGHPNDAIRNIYSLMASIEKNFIAIHHLTDEYKQQQVKGEMESVPTGNKILEGLTGSYRYFDIALRNTKNSKGEIESKISKCGPYPPMEQMPAFKNLDWNSMANIIMANTDNRIPVELRQ